MSQAGIINVIDNNPTIPIYFDGDTGFAVALFNTIRIVGAGGITTSATGNTITIDGSGISIHLTGDTGGSLSPTANNFNIVGGSVAAGTTPVQVNGAVSTLTVNVQRTQAFASSAANRAGIGSFDSTKFTVDANGYVSLLGTAVGQTLTGNTGGAISPTAGNWNILTNGSTAVFGGSGSTLTLNFGITNLLIGTNGSITSGGANTSIGNSALAATTVGGSNFAGGSSALATNTTGTGNTAVGNGAMASFNPGGAVSIQTFNTSVGNNSLNQLTTGTNNTVLGNSAGFSYTTSESSNVLIRNTGTAAESNTIRIGTQGSGNGQQNRAFMAGITGVTVAASAPIAIDTNGQISSLGFGTATQVLTSNGAGTSPTWQAAAAGTVTSVSGTANRITSTGGATPVIDISAAYVGQSSITTLGTITTGVWNGTAIGPTFGGTGLTTYATGDTLYASAANTLAKLAAGSNGQVLTLAAGIPSWATPTTGTVTSVSGTANRITSTGGATPVIDISAAYVGQSSITTLGTIATGVWNGTAVGPTFGGTGLTSYTTGDTLYASASNVLSKLAIGTTGQILTVAGGIPSWATPLGHVIAWENDTAVTAVNMVVNTGYIENNATPANITYTLPVTSPVGSILRVVGAQPVGTWIVAQNAGQSIKFGNVSSTVGVGGSINGNIIGDSVELLCIVADTTWMVISSVGNIAVN